MKEPARTAPIHGVDAEDERRRYLRMVSDYYKRQYIVYQHWPQRKFDALGYRDEKVFRDMNT